MNYSYKGKILIPTPDVSGDIFSRSVVLIVKHDEEGALGMILNKKSGHLSQRMQNIFNYPVEVYEGGPVENDKIFFIAKGTPVTEESVEISPEFYITEDVENIVAAVMDGRLAMEELKIFSGYSGWAPQQLETEIQNKVWTVVEVYNLDYTLPNDQNLWKNIMQNLGGEFLLWANSPDNVSLN